MAITKSDIELELQITFEAGYTDAFFTDLVAYAENILKLKTNRTSFTGSTTTMARYAQLCIAIDRLASMNRKIISSAISSISENGASISFNNGKTLEDYRKSFDMIVNDLKLPGTPYSEVYLPDIDGTHLDTDTSVLY